MERYRYSLRRGLMKASFGVCVCDTVLSRRLSSSRVTSVGAAYHVPGVVAASRAISLSVGHWGASGDGRVEVPSIWALEEDGSWESPTVRPLWVSSAGNQKEPG